MSKLTLWMQMTLDGYASDGQNAFDWPVMGEDLQDYTFDQLSRMTMFAYGAKVFGWMSSWWPNVDSVPEATEGDLRYGKLWVPMPKTVFSRSLGAAEWNTHVAAGELGEEVTAMKERAQGDIAFFGGPTLAHELMKLELFDEYRLFIAPVVLGDEGGQRLFPDLPTRLSLELVASQPFDGGVLATTFVPH